MQINDKSAEWEQVMATLFRKTTKSASRNAWRVRMPEHSRLRTTAYGSPEYRWHQQMEGEPSVLAWLTITFLAALRSVHLIRHPSSMEN